MPGRAASGAESRCRRCRIAISSSAQRGKYSDIPPYDNDEWVNAAIGRGSTPIEGTDYYLFNKAAAEHLGFVQTRI